MITKATTQPPKNRIYCNIKMNTENTVKTTFSKYSK